MFNSVEQFYRKEYFQAIHSITGDVVNRFQQEGFSIIRKIEHLLLDSANVKEVITPEEIHTFYNADIDFEKLKLQLQLLPDVI